MVNREKIVEIIISHAFEVLPELEGRNLTPKDSLKALGANSIDRSEIVMMTLATLSLNMPLVETAKAENIGALAGIIHDKLHSI